MRRPAAWDDSPNRPITEDDVVLIRFATWVVLFILGFEVGFLAAMYGMPWWVSPWASYSVTYFLWCAVGPRNPYAVPRETRDADGR